MFEGLEPINVHHESETPRLREKWFKLTPNFSTIHKVIESLAAVGKLKFGFPNQDSNSSLKIQPLASLTDFISQAPHGILIRTC